MFKATDGGGGGGIFKANQWPTHYRRGEGECSRLQTGGGGGVSRPASGPHATVGREGGGVFKASQWPTRYRRGRGRGEECSRPASGPHATDRGWGGGGWWRGSVQGLPVVHTLQTGGRGRGWRGSVQGQPVVHTLQTGRGGGECSRAANGPHATDGVRGMFEASCLHLLHEHATLQQKLALQ